MMIALHRPSLKLGAFYLAVMMGISLFFSLNVFQLSLDEFSRGFRDPLPGVTSISGSSNAGTMASGTGPAFQSVALPESIRKQLVSAREAQYQEAKDRVLSRLIITNLCILVGGGILSYYLARRTLQPIEEAHEAQSRFTADASHELRTPIAVMQSEIEVALMKPKLTLAEAKKQLHSNLEELARLTALSEGLLRLARLEDNDLQKSPVTLDTVVRRAVERVLPQAESKKMLINPPKKLTAQIIGDEDSLVEALVTILDNAVKYSPAKTEVTMTAEQDKHRVLLRVADRGIGIKAIELQHIFDRFYRADTARGKHKVEGYGLGLAIAKSIVEANGGTIAAASQPGRGTTFTIVLPL